MKLEEKKQEEKKRKGRLPAYYMGLGRMPDLVDCIQRDGNMTILCRPSLSSCNKKKKNAVSIHTPCQ